MAVDKNGKPLPKGVSPRADGRYMGRFTYAGERYTLYDDDNPKRLKKAMDDMRYELEHGLYGSCKNITLDKWFDEYIKTYKEPILKESTVNHYRLYYRLYIQPDMGKKYIKDIKGIHVQKLYNELAKRGMKSNTIKKIANILHSTLKQAVRDDLLLKNPCEAADIPKTEQKERRVLTAKEQREFIDFVSDSAKWQRYYPLFIMAFGTGMRIGELLALRWNDLDFKEKSIRVNKTLQYIQVEGSRECKFIVQSPKTKQSIRTIPMLNNVAEVLKLHREGQRKDIIMLGGIWQKSDNKDLRNLVFTTDTGNPIDRNSINRTIKSIVSDINLKRAEQAGKDKRKAEIFPDFSAHTMRHSFATRCFEADIRPKVIQSFLGHSTLATTMDIYTHVTEENKKEEIEKIANVV